MKDRSTLLTRIYHLKLLFVGALLVILGLLTAALGDWLDAQGAPHLMVALVSGLADVFLVTGAIGIAIDFFTGRDKKAADLELNRAVQKEMLPEYVIAVAQAFATTPKELKRIATPELLDDLAVNALSLRLGDDQFAREIYTDVRDQAIRAPERWYDVDVSIRLSSIDERKTEGLPRFDVLVKWEYTVVPSHPVQKFACVSDRDEFHELVTDIPATLCWFMPKRPGLDAASKDCFELLEFRVDGELQTIRRSARKTGQTYSAHIGPDVVAAAKPVRVSYLYRVVADPTLHRLFFEVGQPTRGLTMKLDYTDTAIARMSVTDHVTSARPVHVTELPDEAAAKVIAIDLTGWLLPRGGFAFAWTMLSELPAATAAAPSDPPELGQDAA